MFTKGISGNPNGRPKGSSGGRAQTLAGLDRLIAKEENQAAILAALENELRTNPAKFFHETIVPLLPRQARDAAQQLDLSDWKPLDRTPPSPTPPTPEAPTP
jgi:hypothetical protein